MTSRYLERYLDVELLDIERKGGSAMVGPMSGEIARLRLADLEDEACHARLERLALRRADVATRPRRLAILRRIRKA